MFQSECKKWLEFFGLKSWDVSYKMEYNNNIYASADIHYKARKATIILGDRFPAYDNIKYRIKNVALHEVLELLLSSIDILARERTFDSIDFEKEKHTVIMTLINIFLK